MDKKVIYLGLMIIALVMMIVCLFIPRNDPARDAIKGLIVIICLAVATMGTIMKERWSIIWWVNAFIWLI